MDSPLAISVLRPRFPISEGSYIRAVHAPQILRAQNKEFDGGLAETSACHCGEISQLPIGSMRWDMRSLCVCVLSVLLMNTCS
jgi:hypothetical protein